MEGIERIKTLAAEVKDKPLLKIIDYLLTRDDMNDKYLNEEKSLKQMIEFIKLEAKKHSQNGIAIIEDSEVYGWAIHYFDEPNESLKLNKASTKENEAEEDTNLIKQKEVNKPINKSKKEWHAEGQLKLFDI